MEEECFALVVWTGGDDGGRGRASGATGVPANGHIGSDDAMSASGAGGHSESVAGGGSRSGRLGGRNAEDMVDCCDCSDQVAYKDSCATGGTKSATRRCKACHNTRRAIHSWYSRNARLEEWSRLSTEEKRQLTVTNRGKGAGKGRRREFVTTETAQCSDDVTFRNRSPFLTKMQCCAQFVIWEFLRVPHALIKLCIWSVCRFFSSLRERYVWASSDEACDEEWVKAQSNPSAVWRRDAYGELTVSLLQSAEASSGRSLSHQKDRTVSSFPVFIHWFHVSMRTTLCFFESPPPTRQYHWFDVFKG